MAFIFGLHSVPNLDDWLSEVDKQTNNNKKKNMQ